MQHWGSLVSYSSRKRRYRLALVSRWNNWFRYSADTSRGGGNNLYIRRRVEPLGRSHKDALVDHSLAATMVCYSGHKRVESRKEAYNGRWCSSVRNLCILRRLFQPPTSSGTQNQTTFVGIA